MSFADDLNLVLEDRPTGQNPLDAAIGILHELGSAKQQIVDLQDRLDSIKKQMSGNLALGIRRNHPSLNVSVNPDGCQVGYKSKNLLFNPDIERGVWSVTSEDPRFIGKFKSVFGRNTALSPNLDSLVSAITDYFTGHYKSLSEDIIGTGAVILEGKRVSLRDITKYGYQPKQVLQTRLARRQAG